MLRQTTLENIRGNISSNYRLLLIWDGVEAPQIV